MTIELIPESIRLIRMSDEEYFSEEYSDYISNSKLSLINPDEGGSVEKFKRGFKNEYVPAFEIGTAVHSMLLQKDSYEIANIKKPNAKLGIFAENVYNNRLTGLTLQQSIDKASAEVGYYFQKLSTKRLQTAIKSSLDFYLKRIHFKPETDKTVLFLSESHYDVFHNCMNGIDRNPEFKKILEPEGIVLSPEVFNEYAILAEVKIGDKVIKVKGKIDNFTINDELNELTLNDIKTTGKPVNYFMGNYIFDKEGNKEWIDGSFQKYRYYRQLAMYGWLLQSAIKVSRGVVYNLKSNILVVETIPNFNTRICRINNQSIQFGLKEFKKLLILAANEC